MVAFRGLCVRMGLHSGLDDPSQIAFNKVGSAYQYCGPFATIAKLVSDAAPGGLITLSGQAFARLRHGSTAAAAGAPPSSSRSRPAPDPLVIYAGHHVLPGDDVAPAVPPAPARPSTGSNASRSRAQSQVAVRMDSGLGTGPSQARPGSALLRSILGGALTNGSILGGAQANGGARPSRGQIEGLSSGERDPSGRHVRRQADMSQPLSNVVVNPLGLHGPGWEEGTQRQLGIRSHSLSLAAPPPLVCRLALAPPLRTVRAVQKGVGASTLLADLPGPAARALAKLHRLAGALLGSAGGYLVETGNGLVLAAFGGARRAVDWALECVDGVRGMELDEELLAHELCAEELALPAVLTAAAEQPMAMGPRGFVRPSLVATRPGYPAVRSGLRLKVGLDMGSATHMLTESSGRLSYRGRVMNRAARVAGVAAAGQVLCTVGAWDACEQEGIYDDGVSGISLGAMSLKGLSAPVGVVQCVRE
ncbi:hypothetical protein HYH03_015495 [Edaphochlamys debaryana]|nr:hypothetical protein HYH03_015495 [Edaphochlamys debaryana]|eukprot:KAG2485784.1 hypothetical protein HYH03_015495 [Edaphochlamys debaryana]